MTDLFDAEPEDSWDRGDPVDELVDNLIRRAALLDADALIPRGDPGVTLDALIDLVAAIRTRNPTGRDRVRVDELDADIEYVITVRL